MKAKKVYETLKGIEFKTPRDVQEYFRKQWNEHQKTARKEDKLPFIEYINQHTWLLNGTEWKWNPKNNKFEKSQE